ncbi:MAG: hypothetical protein KDD41_11115 [Flavobacteriales bacterium]|nr:hypothetical protein [Flavobacteriales bacterium]
MANITYYIGAGASCNSLPLAKDMHQRLIEFKEYIIYLIDEKGLNNHFSNSYLTELDKIIRLVFENGTIDTCARTMYLNGRQSMDLVRLKSILSGYILFEQTRKDEGFLTNKDSGKQDHHNRVIDQRYPAFITNQIDGNSRKLKDNIKIISWNYDSQFELSYSNVVGCPIDMALNQLNVYPSPYTNTDENYSIIKLNGTAGLTDEHNRVSAEYLSILEFDPLSSMNFIIDLLKSNNQRNYVPNQLFFAWEDYHIPKNSKELAKKIISETDILIAIGYSFPDYNLEVDRYIFDGNRIEKMYYQVPPQYFEDLKLNIAKVNSDLLQVCENISRPEFLILS